MMRGFSTTFVAGLFAVACLVSSAQAQNFPNKPITIVVPYSAGGTGDVVARQLADRLNTALGQPVIVENRPGANGSLGSRHVASAAPDGYTLLIGQPLEISINKFWMKNPGYDGENDLVPIALCATVPLALVVPKAAPYSTIGEYIAFLKSGKPSTFASVGAGSSAYFASELLKKGTNANMVHIPYKGAGPVMNDLVGGHVDMYFAGFPGVASHIASNTVKLLAVGSGTRSEFVPNTPTVKEASGIEGFDIELWVALFAPKGTPKEIVDRLNSEVNKILATAEMREKFKTLGASIKTTTADEMAAFAKSEAAKYQKIMQDTGIKPD